MNKLYWGDCLPIMLEMPLAVAPLPEEVTAEDIGRAMVRQIKPVEKSETRESGKHSERNNE